MTRCAVIRCRAVGKDGKPVANLLVDCHGANEERVGSVYPVRWSRRSPRPDGRSAVDVIRVNAALEDLSMKVTDFNRTAWFREFGELVPPRFNPATVEDCSGEDLTARSVGSSNGEFEIHGPFDGPITITVMEGGVEEPREATLTLAPPAPGAVQDGIVFRLEDI